MRTETYTIPPRLKKPILHRYFLCLLLAWPWSQAAAEPITLNEALRIALERSPALAVEQAAVAEAEARLKGAGIWQQNPEASIEAAARLGPEDPTADAAPRGRGPRLPAAGAAVADALRRRGAAHQAGQ